MVELRVCVLVCPGGVFFNNTCIQRVSLLPVFVSKSGGVLLRHYHCYTEEILYLYQQIDYWLQRMMWARIVHRVPVLRRAHECDDELV